MTPHNSLQSKLEAHTPFFIIICLLLLFFTLRETFFLTRSSCFVTAGCPDITACSGNHFLSFEAFFIFFSAGCTPWPTFSVVLIIWNILNFDWITSRLAGSASSPSAHPVPFHKYPRRVWLRAGERLNHGAAPIDWKKYLNLYLNLFISPPSPSDGWFAVCWHMPSPCFLRRLELQMAWRKCFMYHLCTTAGGAKWLSGSISEDGGDNAVLPSLLFSSPPLAQRHPFLCKCHYVAYGPHPWRCISSWKCHGIDPTRRP